MKFVFAFLTLCLASTYCLADDTGMTPEQLQASALQQVKDQYVEHVDELNSNLALNADMLGLPKPSSVTVVEFKAGDKLCEYVSSGPADGINFGRMRTAKQYQCSFVAKLSSGKIENSFGYASFIEK